MIDWNAPLQTRDGRSVRVYTRFGNHRVYPVVGEIGDDATQPPILARWDKYGRIAPSAGQLYCHSDIVNVPEKHELRLEVDFYGGGGFGYRIYLDQKQEASSWIGESKIVHTVVLEKEFDVDLS